MIALQRQDVAVARRSFDKALSLDQNSLDALTGLVMLDIGTRQPAEAIKRIDERLTRTPNAASVHMLAARAKLANKDQAGAEASLRKAIELDASLLQAYSLLGGIYLSQKKPDEAIAEFERVVTKQPKNIAAHTMIGMILQAQGKGAEAQKRYEQIVTMDSRAAVASNNLAWMYAEADINLDQALTLAQAAKAQLPDQPEVNDTLGYRLSEEEPGHAGRAAAAPQCGEGSEESHLSLPAGGRLLEDGRQGRGSQGAAGSPQVEFGLPWRRRREADPRVAAKLVSSPIRRRARTLQCSYRSAGSGFCAARAEKGWGHLRPCRLCGSYEHR